MSDTLYNKLDLINNAKQDIKASLINMGQNATNDITTYSNLISNISSTPNGIFIQENTPTKTTSEAFWLKSYNKSSVPLSEQIPDDLTFYHGSSSSSWLDIKRKLTAEQLALFDSFSTCVYYADNAGASQQTQRQIMIFASDNIYVDGNSVIVASKPCVWIRYYYSTLDCFSITAEDTSNNNKGYIDRIQSNVWANKDIYSGSSQQVIYPSCISDEETGLYIDVANTRYVVQVDKSNSWNKVLDTSTMNASAADILINKTAVVNNTKITGTMNNLGDLSIIPNLTGGTVGSGFVNSINISAVTSSIDSNITANNIANGVNILGVIGTLDSGTNTMDATALDTDIAVGKTAYVNGVKINGTLNYLSNLGDGIAYIPTNILVGNEPGLPFDILLEGNVTSMENMIVSDGDNIQAYVQNSNLASALNIVPNMIANGQSILGVNGNYEGGTNTADANATNLDIKIGKTAYVNGVKITGILEPNGGNDINYITANAYERAMLIGETVFNINYARNFYSGGYYMINMNNTLNAYGLPLAISLSGLVLTDERLTNLCGMCKDRVNLLYGPNFVDTSNVTDMSKMFSGCVNMGGVANYNTINVINMSSMFAQCNHLGLAKPVPNFDTSNVVDMSSMFLNCFGLNYIPNFDTSNATNMADMFNTLDRQKNYQANITECPNFNTYSVTNMAKMLRGTKIINAPNFDMSSVEDVSGLFTRCYNLSNVPNYTFLMVSNTVEMFSQCNNLTDAPSINFISSASINANGMFKDCFNLVNVPSFDGSSINDASQMFLNCYNLTHIGNIHMNNTQDVLSMFKNCYSLVDIGDIYASKLTNMNNLFAGCKNIVNIGEIYAPNLTSAGNMFFATGQGNLSNNSIRNIINMCINATNYAVKNLSNINSYSPLYGTKFDNSYYTDMWSDLDNAGWTY